ncbi:MAG: class I SAM-dependent methyltransferase [Pseudomonadota bacterium]
MQSTNSAQTEQQDDHQHQGAQGLLSPFLQRQRVRAAQGFMRGAVLDIGCGNGALAEHCNKAGYIGVDRDPATLLMAKAHMPAYTFQPDMPEKSHVFDTIAALAVIEHIAAPAKVLADWAEYMAPNGHMVLTTPKPAFEWVHEAGARIGLFSHDAAEEHETLIDEASMHEIAAEAGLYVEVYRSFLGGANQLFVLKR